VSEILTCQCGAKIRIPEQHVGSAFGCPKCKQLIGGTGASAIRVSPVVDQRQLTTCPICQTHIQPGESAIDCLTCSQSHHEECWNEVGGCSTYGCKQAPAAEKENPTAQPLTAWGDDKICPVCGEKIKSIALKCRYCATTFDTVDPLSLRDLHRKDSKATQRKQICNITVALFAVSLLGCTAPLMAIINPIYILPRRSDLTAEGPFYLILGYSAIALSVLYSIMILFALIGGMG